MSNTHKKAISLCNQMALSMSYIGCMVRYQFNVVCLLFESELSSSWLAVVLRCVAPLTKHTVNIETVLFTRGLDILKHGACF